MKKLGRRNFIAALGTSVAGYSLFVKAPQSVAADSGLIKESAAAELPAGLNLNFKPIMKPVDLKCDVLVAGGGLAGICAALAAARDGSKVILVQNRSRLGGNASAEVRMHPLGIDNGRFGQREGGIIEELKLENAANNPQLSWDVWDFMLYDKCMSEPNITLLLDTDVCGAKVSDGTVKYVYARSDSDMTEYKIKAKIFIDSTGDSRLALECGAEVMSGREGYDAFGETLATYDDIGTRQGSTILFTSRKYDKPMPFTAPSWAKKITAKDLSKRGISKNDLSYGYWWIELGGDKDAIRDTNQIRFELLSVVMGVWDYIKNSGKYPDAENRALDFVGMLPGRRDTMRVVGDHIMTQDDITDNWKKFDDAIAVGGWSMDDHPKEGFSAAERNPCRQVETRPYNIPFGSTYAKGFNNLMMAGRNMSCSHVAFTSTRVMNTSAAVGQAVGTAASICAKENITPRQLRNNPEKLHAFQQKLLRDDQTIIGIANDDPKDLARLATVRASKATEGSRPENIISGITIDAPGKNDNRWLAPASEKPWIVLEWDNPQKISSARILFDSWHAALTQSSADYLLPHIHRGPEPRLAKDYTLTAILPDGTEKVVADVKDNHQKLRVHNFDPIEAKALRLDVLSTNGAITSRVKEIRVEG